MPARCTGITKAGVRCAKVATRSPHEGAERAWCPQHAPEDAVKDVPRCGGKLRNGIGCPSAPVYIAVYEGEEIVLCAQHMGVFNDSDGKTLQTPPKQKKKPMTRIAQPSEPIPDTNGDDGPRTRKKSHNEGSLRERLVTSTEELYSEIHDALENTIRNATKRRMTACPSCGHRFSVLIPDHGAVVAAANTLLAKAIPTTASTEEEIARLDNTPVEELRDLSTGDLKRLLHNREWGTVRMEAEAETLEETVERHLAVIAEYADVPDPEELPRVSFAKRELLRLRRVAEQLQPVLRANLPLLPGERRPSAGGSRTTLDGKHGADEEELG